MQNNSQEIFGLPVQTGLRYFLGLTVIGLSLLIAFLYLSRNIFFDDAFMFIRYAHNLLEYGVFGWNPEEAAYGCTSMGYVFSNYLFLLTGLDDLLGQARFLVLESVFYFFLALIFIHKSNLLILDKKPAIRWEVSFGVLLLVLLNPLLRRNLTGMDTMMSLWGNALLVYTAFIYYRKRTQKSLLLFALAAYFSFFIRPDNGLYATIFPILFILIWGEGKKELPPFLLGFGSLMNLDSLIKYLYFGAILPIPFYVKNQGFYEAYLGIDLWNAWKYLADFMLDALPFFVISYFFKNTSGIRRSLPFLLPFVLTQLYFTQAVQVMGFESRLLLPSLPFIIADSLISLNFWQKEDEYSPKKVVEAIILPVCLVGSLILIFNLWGRQKINKQKLQALENAKAYELNLPPKVDNDSLAWYAVVLVNELIEEVGDEDFVFAASEHGFLSSQHTDKRILCLVGLHNTESLKGKALNSTEMQLSLEKYQPDLIWMPHPDYPALNYYLIHAPYFQSNYDFYPDLLDFGIAIRRGGIYQEKIIEKLQALYPNKTF
ncbi:MAG: hypothetical protein AAF696_11510 [Bacteroidota bacterium]